MNHLKEDIERGRKIAVSQWLIVFPPDDLDGVCLCVCGGDLQIMKSLSETLAA